MKIFQQLLLLNLILLVSNSTFAKSNSTINVDVKGNFTGRIFNQSTGLPVESATVYITDLKVGSITNKDGFFSIGNIAEGTHTVEISHISYSTIVETIFIKGNTNKDFALTSIIIENNTVVVTGVSGATQLKKVPFAVEVLRSKDLFQNTSTNIIESLSKISGVNTISTGSAISKPVIRGLSYNRVLTINDGVRQEGQQWGDEHGIEIDEASVQKVEVLKGPASLIYGSDATAGVVNIISNVPLPNNTLKAALSSNYQTNNRLRSINANIGANHNGFNWNIYTSNKSAADYKNKYDGYVFNSKFTENNVGGYVGYNGKWGYSHFLLSNFNLKAGMIEGDRNQLGQFIKTIEGGNEEVATSSDFKSTTPKIPYQHIRHFKIATDNSIYLGKNVLNFNIGYQRNQRDEFGNPDDINDKELSFNLQTVTYNALFKLQENKGWKTTVGINGMLQNNENLGEEQLIPDYELFDFGILGYTQKTIGKYNFSGGLRFDNRNMNAENLLEGSQIKNEGFKKSFSNISGSIGVSSQITSKLNLKLNLARGFRAPSIPELASNGAHEGTTRYEYGDANLKSETSWQIDAGASYTGEHVSLSVSAFANIFDNFIFYRKLLNNAGTDSTILIDNNPLTAFKFDQGKTVLTGLEATLDIHPHPLDWLHFLNTFSMVRGRFNESIDGSRNIPFMPSAKLNTELRANMDHLNKFLKNGYFKIELVNSFAQNKIFSAYNTETSTPAYTLLNVGIGTDIVNKKQQTLFSLNFAAMNIGDVAYQNHLSRLKYTAENMATGRTGVYNMGRNFSFKLLIPFNMKLK